MSVQGRCIPLLLAVTLLAAMVDLLQHPTRYLVADAALAQAAMVQARMVAVVAERAGLAAGAALAVIVVKLAVAAARVSTTRPFLFF